MTPSRRSLLKMSLAAAGLAATGGSAMAATSSSFFPSARAALDRLGEAIPRRDVVGVADFSAPSRAPRFHLLDMASGRSRSFLVAHGRGSDPDHSGWLRSFSNVMGSA